LAQLVQENGKLVMAFWHCVQLDIAGVVVLMQLVEAGTPVTTF